MRINMLSDYLKNIYGRKVYKLSLSGGMTCPNRDGVCGEGGCIFCSEEGAGEFAEKFNSNIHLQIDNAKKHLKDREREFDGYIAYFQAFSNTYADTEYLRRLYTEVINRDDILILSIATRPDCISDECLALLSSLDKQYPDKSDVNVHPYQLTKQQSHRLLFLRIPDVQDLFHSYQFPNDVFRF